jgi:hypothetical protein
VSGGGGNPGGSAGSSGQEGGGAGVGPISGVGGVGGVGGTGGVSGAAGGAGQQQYLTEDCTQDGECPAETCQGGLFTPASECSEGLCTTPPTIGCAGECGSGGCLSTSFVYADASSSPLRGNVTNESAEVTDQCPDDSVVIGVDVALIDELIGQVRLVCGTLALSPVDSSSVLVVPAWELSWRGSAAGLVAKNRCPDHQMVVAFEGRAGTILDQLQLHCAPLLRNGDSLVPGTAQAIAPLGGDGGIAFDVSACPPGSVAGGGIIRTDHWVVALGLTCETAHLQWLMP